MRRDSEEYLDLCCAAGYGTVSYKVAKAVMKEIEQAEGPGVRRGRSIWHAHNIEFDETRAKN
jgi:hypothetical protein